MMKRIRLLTWLFTKNMFHMNSDSSGGKKKRKISSTILYGFLYLYLGGVVLFGSNEIIGLFNGLGIAEQFLSWILSANAGMVFFTTIMMSINVLYFSKDSLAVLPLPIQPLEIVAAKINSIVIYNFLTACILGVLPLILYGIKTSQGVLYYPLAFLSLFTSVVTPAVAAVFIIILLMSFSKVLKNKSLVQTLTTGAAILLSLGISMFSSQIGSNEQMAEMLINGGSAISTIERLLPTILLARQSIQEVSILKYLLLLVATIAVYAAVLLVSNRLYFRGLLGASASSEGISRKKIDAATAFRQKGVVASYVSKELKTLYRRSYYLTQLILPCVILPFFMIGMIYFSMKTNMPPEVYAELISAIKQMGSDSGMRSIFLMIVWGAMCISSMYSFLSVVAISKDGEDAFFMRQIPLPFYKQLIYKAIPDFAAYALIHLVVGILIRILVPIPLLTIAEALLLTLPSAFLHASMILLDLRNPNLHWSNEAEVVKKNFKTLIPIGFALLSAGIMAVLVFALELSDLTVMAILFTVYTALSLLIYTQIRKNSDKLLSLIR